MSAQGCSTRPRTSQAIRTRLVAALDRHDALAIAVSGGVDSMTLAHVAWRYSRARTTMYHATGPAVPAAARSRVEEHAARHGWPLVLLDAGEQADVRYRANPVDRCYYCKSNLYARIGQATSDPIASGTNRDDLADFRPGLRAAAERDVVHPYVEAAIDKSDVYALAADLGLDDLERLPAQPCLASRVETGIAIAAGRSCVHRRRGDAPRRAHGTRGGAPLPRDARGHRHRARAWPTIRRARRDGPAKSGATRALSAGRAFAGVRPYARGAAFLRKARDG